LNFEHVVGEKTHFLKGTPTKIFPRNQTCGWKAMKS
jgi:hypothetical protein